MPGLTKAEAKRREALFDERLRVEAHQRNSATQTLTPLERFRAQLQQNIVENRPRPAHTNASNPLAASQAPARPERPEALLPLESMQRYAQQAQRAWLQEQQRAVRSPIMLQPLRETHARVLNTVGRTGLEHDDAFKAAGDEAEWSNAQNDRGQTHATSDIDASFPPPFGPIR